MPIYAAKLVGRRSCVLVKADNKSEAMGRFVSVESLSAEKMQDALNEGDKVWRAGTPLPDDQPEPEQPEAPAASSDPMPDIRA